MKMRRGAWVAVLVVVAGCGGSDDAEEGAAVAGAPTVPICEAVLPGELESFLGSSFAAGTPKVAEGEIYRCEWESAAAEQGIVTLTLHPDAAASLEQYTAMTGMQEIEGVGDAAWWSDAVQTYVMRLGERLFVVGFGWADGNHRHQAEQIIQRAMERV